MANVIELPVLASQDADEHARADTQRKLRLDKAVAAARSIQELCGIPFNADRAERGSTRAINRSVCSIPWSRTVNPLAMREDE